MIEQLLHSSQIKTAYNAAQDTHQDIYLVGGAIRDLFLTGSLSQDLDFIVTDNTESIASALSESFHGNYFCQDKKRDSYRSLIEDKNKCYTLDFSCIFSNELHTDLMNRDFSINSIALKLDDLFERNSLNFSDPVGGIDDLKKRIVRVSTPLSFQSDPIRILRAVRISLTHNLTIDSATRTLILETKELLSSCPWERIKNELFIIISLPDAIHSLRVLDSLGLLTLLIPEMQTFKGMNQGKHHDYDLWEHSIRTVHFTETILQNLNNYFPQHGNALIDYFKEQLENGINRSNLLKFISLIHDTGKPSALAQNANNVIFYGHDIIGRRINQGIAKRFKIGNKSSTIITAATQNHMRLLNLSQLNIITSRAKFRFFYDLNSAALDTIVLAIADLMSTRKCSPGSDDHIPILNLVSDLIDYYFCEYSSKSIKPLINGHEIMEILNLEPGERIGELLCLIEDAERKGAVSNRDEAIKFITSHHIKTTENR